MTDQSPGRCRRAPAATGPSIVRVCRLFRGAIIIVVVIPGRRYTGRAHLKHRHLDAGRFRRRDIGTYLRRPIYLYLNIYTYTPVHLVHGYNAPRHRGAGAAKQGKAAEEEEEEEEGRDLTSFVTFDPHSLGSPAAESCAPGDACADCAEAQHYSTPPAAAMMDRSILSHLFILPPHSQQPAVPVRPLPLSLSISLYPSLFL